MERPNKSQICHPIASPSRSSSVAIMTSSDLAISERIFSICLSFNSSWITEYLVKKLFSISMDSRPEIVLKCPNDAITLYPGPK